MKKKLTAAGIVLALILGILGVNAWQNYQEQLRLERLRHEAAMAELAQMMERTDRSAKKANEAYIADQTAVYEKECDETYREETVGTLSKNADMIGDSVMLGAAALLKSTFPGAYVDAAVNRAYYPMLNIISKRASDKTLGDPVIIGIGTNGPLNDSVCRQALDLCEGHQVFWITTNNNWQFYNTDTILAFGEDYENVTIIDWDTYSEGHDEYFYRDGIHLNPEGRAAYVQLIRESITERYWELLPHDKHRTLLASDGSLAVCSDLFESLDENTDVLLYEELDPDTVSEQLYLLGDMHIRPENVLLVMKDPTVLKEIMDQIAKEYSDMHVEAILVQSEESEQQLPDPKISLFTPYTDFEMIFAEDQIHLSAEASDQLSSQIRNILNALNRSE